MPWTCRQCSATNATEALLCAVCTGSRPLPRPWLCGQCETPNKAFALHCELCGTAAHLGRVVGEPAHEKSGLWYDLDLRWRIPGTLMLPRNREVPVMKKVPYISYLWRNPAGKGERWRNIMAFGGVLFFAATVPIVKGWGVGLAMFFLFRFIWQSGERNEHGENEFFEQYKAEERSEYFREIGKEEKRLPTEVEMEAHARAVAGLGFFETTHLFSVDVKGEVRIHAPFDGDFREHRPAPGGMGEAQYAFSRKCLYIAETGRISVLRAGNFRLGSFDISPEPAPPRTMIVDPEGRSLALLREDGHLETWTFTNEVSSIRPEPKFAGQPHTEPARHLALHPEANAFALGFESGDIALFHLDGTAKIPAFSAFDSPVDGLIFSPDGRHILAWSGPRMRLIRLENTFPLVEYRAQTTEGVPTDVTRAHFSADGHSLYAGTADGSLLQWRLGSGHLEGRHALTTGALLRGAQDLLRKNWIKLAPLRRH
ncbi:MAG: hypothetical protein AAF570_19940 [Bacteroidota bacterium]